MSRSTASTGLSAASPSPARPLTTGRNWPTSSTRPARRARSLADTAYRSKTNEAQLAKHGRRSKIHFRRQPGHDLTPAQREANRARSKVRSAVETVFAGHKHRFGLFVRTIGLARARTKIGLTNLAYNLKRFLWLEARPVAARGMVGADPMPPHHHCQTARTPVRGRRSSGRGQSDGQTPPLHGSSRCPNR
nr:transposase [Methylobacterium sp. FF17]